MSRDELGLGTGTNAAYVEQAAKIGKGRGVEDGSRETEMAINTEWGNLDTAAVRNEHDAAVDAASENPGLQRFEKMVSGMYLGELLRTALAAPAVRAGFSRTCAAGFDAAFSERFSLHTSTMAAIEADATPDLAEVARDRPRSPEVARGRRIWTWTLLEESPPSRLQASLSPCSTLDDLQGSLFAAHRAPGR